MRLRREEKAAIAVAKKDATSKYVYNFDVYCGRTIEAHVRVPVRHGDPSVAQEVVLNLVEDLYGKGHVITMDNYFTSIPLFKELLFRGFMQQRLSD